MRPTRATKGVGRFGQCVADLTTWSVTAEQPTQCRMIVANMLRNVPKAAWAVFVTFPILSKAVIGSERYIIRYSSYHPHNSLTAPLPYHVCSRHGTVTGRCQG